MSPRPSPPEAALIQYALRPLVGLGLAVCALATASAQNAPVNGASVASPAPTQTSASVELNPRARERMERLARVAKYLDAATRSDLARLAAFGPSPAAPGSYHAQQLTLADGRIAWLQAISTDVAPVIGAASAPPSGAPAPGGQPRTVLVPGVGGYDLLLRITVPSTGLDELFSLYVPGTPANVERPLLVGFHSFGVSHLDLLFSTTFFFECEQRDWFMVAPLQFSAVGDPQAHYSSPQSQNHVEAVLEWVTSVYAIDRERVFGVGFSQGGGAALSYAARHRDDRAVEFAAVANHTGAVSNRGVYLNSPPAIRGQMEAIFGGPPGQRPYEYQRASVLDTNSVGDLIPGGRHMASNLESTPILSVYGFADPLGYLIEQSIALNDYMDSLPSASHTLLGATVPAPCFQNGLTGHCWQTLDETFVCDWFSDKELRDPSRGSLVMDRSGRWDMIDVQQTAAGDFSLLDYLFEETANRFILFDRENISRLGVDVVDAGLDPSSTVDIATTAVDGAPVQIDVDGFGGQPSQVLRNGAPVVQSCVPPGLFPTWCFHASTGRITLNETGGALAVWEIVP